MTVVFVSPSGERFEAKGRVGQNVLDVATENDVNIEGVLSLLFRSFFITQKTHHYQTPNTRRRVRRNACLLDVPRGCGREELCKA